MDAVLDRVRRDARALAEAGLDGAIVENYGDTPFLKGAVPPLTVAALTRAVDAAAAEVGDALALGVNVLRNDATAALSIAAACRAAFVRVNVLAGVAVTDQGLIEGDAASVMRLRRAWAPEVRVLADVHVKHARPLAARPLEEVGPDVVERALADGLIVTGERTGLGVAVRDLALLRDACPSTPLLAGSGVHLANVAEILRFADGVIVGTSIEEGGRTGAPVDVEAARQLVDLARETSDG